MRRALPLSIQLLLTFVGLLVGLAVVLTSAAHKTLRTNLESDATRHVSLATRSREQTLTQLFQLRQQRAEGFLATVVSYCGEPTGSLRVGWVDSCFVPMVEEFRKSELAVGSFLTYRNRPLKRSGRRVARETPIRPALARVVRTSDGAIEYVMKAELGDLALTLQFNDSSADQWVLPEEFC